MIDQRTEKPDRRAPKYAEKLSTALVLIAGVGAFIVILDPKYSGTVFGDTFSVGGGFSAEMKGAVIQLMLIGGFVAVTKFWLDASASGLKQAESISRIAEQSAPVTAAAVHAALAPQTTPAKPLKADDVSVEAAGDVTVAQK